MKKILSALIILLVLGFSGEALATWTLTQSMVSRTSHYILWKVLCTSDGNSLTATDIVAEMSDNMKRFVTNSTLMVMKISPGTDSVIPNTTIDIILSDAQGTAIFTHTTYSKDAETTGILLSEDYGAYPPVLEKLYLTLNDIGDSGDQVTLYFLCWIE
jgi:hypothetical protein